MDEIKETGDGSLSPQGFSFPIGHIRMLLARVVNAALGGAAVGAVAAGVAGGLSDGEVPDRLVSQKCRSHKASESQKARDCDHPGFLLRFLSAGVFPDGASVRTPTTYPRNHPTRSHAIAIACRINPP